MRITLAIFFIFAGTMHFVIPDAYAHIVPPMLPAPHLLVVVSGVAEILGGLGLLIPFTQRAAAWALIALLVAVFPANIYMAVAHVPAPGILGLHWVQWLRLPLQIPLVLWAMRYARQPKRRSLPVS